MIYQIPPTATEPGCTFDAPDSLRIDTGTLIQLAPAKGAKAQLYTVVKTAVVHVGEIAEGAYAVTAIELTVT